MSLSEPRGDKSKLKTRYYALLAFATLLPLAAAASAGIAYGQSCGLQVGSMVASTQNASYYGAYNAYNVQLTVPLSMSCQNVGPQVWATGTAYDTVTNTNLGTNNAVMNWNNGYYSGQLVFNLPSSIVQHQLQVQIQVYNNYNNGQYSGLIASSSPTVTVQPSSSSPYTTSYYNGYPTGCYNGYYYYSYGGYPYNYGYPNYSSCSSYYYSYPYYYYYYSYPYYYYGYGYYGYGYHHHH